MREHLHANQRDLWERHRVRVPEVDRVTVTRVVFLRGEGCCSEDPMRRVTAYFDDEGRLLWQDDPLAHVGEGSS